MDRYKLDNRVLVQIEESFKLNRETATELLQIRRLDSKTDMYYLEKKPGLPLADSKMPADLKRSQGVIKVDNRASANTKEASEVVNEQETPAKFMGWLLA